MHAGEGLEGAGSPAAGGKAGGASAGDGEVATAAAAVRRLLAGPALHLPLEVVAATGSTNSDLLDAACQAATPRCARWALRQQAGRGRNGRTWLSSDGSLTFSVRWPFQRQGSALLGLPLAVAVGCCQGLEDLGVAGLAIKWPNDLLRRERKLGGVLVEVAGGHAVIGVGLNVRLDADIDAALGIPAADLQTAGQPTLSRPLVLASVLTRLVPALERFEEAGFAAFRGDWSSRAAWIGQRVRLGSDLEGTLLGVDASGALRILTGHGEQRGLAGDLSLRPLPRAAD